MQTIYFCLSSWYASLYLSSCKYRKKKKITVLITIFWVFSFKGHLDMDFLKTTSVWGKISFLYQKLPSWEIYIYFFFQNDRFGKQELSKTFPLQERHHKTFIRVKQCNHFVLVGSQFQCIQVEFLGLSGHCGLCFFLDSFMVLSQHSLIASNLG